MPAAALFAFFLVGAIPLLPVFVRPLTTHRRAGVRCAGKVLAMALLWLAFDVSLMATWGAFRFAPDWWALFVGFPLLQIPAAWLSHRVAFGAGDRST